MRSFIKVIPAIVLALFLPSRLAADGEKGWSSWPGADLSGGNAAVSGEITEDVYLAGASVTVAAEVTGDVVAAGGIVNVGGNASEGVLAAGGVVNVTGNVTDDVRAAGGVVTLQGAVAQDAVLAGGSVTLLPQSSVGRRAFLAGGVVKVDGPVGGDVRVAAGKVFLNGSVSGTVRIVAEEVEIGQNASVEGDLVCLSKVPARVASGASIKGEFRQEALPTKGRRHREWSPWGPIVFFLLWILALAAAGSVFFLLFPSFVDAAAGKARSGFWACLGLGLAGLVTVPLVAILLAVTIVGIPLAVVLAVLYPVLLVTGYLAGAWFLAGLLASWIFRGRGLSRRSRVGLFFLAALVLSLAGLVPILGWWAAFVLFLVGMGSVMHGVHAAWKAGRAAA